MAPAKHIEYAAAGWREVQLPAAPTGAASSIRSESLGKVPGVFMPALGRWKALEGWTEYQTTAADIIEWDRTGAGVSIRTGLVVGGDLDCRDPVLAAGLEALFLDRLDDPFLVPPIRYGHWPKRMIIVQTDDPSPKVDFSFSLPGEDTKARGYKWHKVELLGTGQQFIAEGIHNGTFEPYWYDPKTPHPTVIGRAGLPFMSRANRDAFMEEAKAYLREHSCTIKSGRTAGGSAGTYSGTIDPERLEGDPDMIERLMAIIPNDVDYATWTAAGIALEGATRKDPERGKGIWIDWSLGYDGNTVEVCEEKWGSFHAKFAGARKLLEMGREYGFWEDLYPPFAPYEDAPDDYVPGTGRPKVLALTEPPPVRATIQEIGARTRATMLAAANAILKR